MVIASGGYYVDFNYLFFLVMWLRTTYKKTIWDIVDTYRKNNGERKYTLVHSPGEIIYADVVLTSWVEIKNVLLLSGNNYLWLRKHPFVLNYVHKMIDMFGVWSIWSQYIAWTSPLLLSVEKEMASLHKKQAVVVFPSAFTANLWLIGTLLSQLCLATKEELVVCSDALNHASIIDGIQKAQQQLGDKRDSLQKIIFAHNDTVDLQNKLSIHKGKNIVIIVESIYSMGWDGIHLQKICDIAQEMDALVILDETNTVFAMGAHGAGYADVLGLADSVDIVVWSWWKAGGSIGWYCACSQEVAIMLKTGLSRPFTFTTANSIPDLATVEAVATLLKTADWDEIMKKFVEINKYAREQLQIAEFDIWASSSHIIPIMIRDTTRANNIAEALLLEDKIYIQPINFPTVARWEERFRITFTPYHTKEHVDHFIECLKKQYNQQPA